MQALARVAADAVGSTTEDRREAALSAWTQHQAIAAITWTGSDGAKVTRRRTVGASQQLYCATSGGGTVCLEGIAARATSGKDLLPWLIAGLCSGLLALMAWRGRAAGGEFLPITEAVERATREQNYSARIAASAPSGERLATAVNTLFEQIESRDLMLRRRSLELEEANKELEAFSYSVSHDLRAPLGSIDGFSQALIDYCSDELNDEAREYVRWIRDASTQMQNLVEALLNMSRLNQHEMVKGEVDLTNTADGIVAALRKAHSDRNVTVRVTPGMRTYGDERLLHAVLENMLSNAWKFTAKRTDAMIEVGFRDTDDARIFFVRDNGAGFDPTYASRLFTAFQRLHSRSDFDGTGIGLATVKRIIERHGGTVWAEGAVNEGATFYFTTGDRRSPRREQERISA